MPQFALLCPTEDELSDAREALGELLERCCSGGLDLPPYLTRLLEQLQDILLATSPQPLGGRSPVANRPSAASRA